ncbi:RAS guanyl-releasing protein 4 isoform X2 [Engraulis encrasicolus]|uniref:RAS guanyl-releasing protein 4 isoform X2 n=1 Tax=Engraulis encrasicolus TaxID=184585 RepID=UPI002FD45BDB
MIRKEAKRKSRQESVTGLKCRRPVQRRMTCPSPQEIQQALQSPGPNSLISAACLDELIQRCLHCFDAEGKLCRGTQFVHMTLMMHSWVVPSQTFANKLLSIYKDPVDKKGLRRAQMYHFIRQWINKFPVVFEEDPLLRELMGDFWEPMRAAGKDSPPCPLIDTSYLNTPANLPQVPSPSVKKRKVSLLFDHMEPEDMAKLLTELEFRNFCNVSFLDYRSYVVHGSVRDNPALERSVMLCNGVSQWVQLMILNRHTAQQRSEVFTKFTQVAQKLRSLQNFNTLMAVIGGLCHSSISRLKDTASLLSSDVIKALSEMAELLSSLSNYGNYRRVYSECTGFKVPILGVHLKDLISLNEGLPDYVENDKINVGKLQHLYSNISELLAIHECKMPFVPNKDLLPLLTLSLDLYYTEDEIYELSYAKEPKNPKIQPATPVDPPAVAEWGSCAPPRLDPNRISKHVKQMVDSIMKNYDLNMDGYISREDFNKIAGNFPFSFCMHESDRQGEISRQEIMSYFMRGMSICAKLGYNGLQNLHNFHETTYKKPTFCDTCGGFLWGVLKRGYHCKDCGVNCHKQCKDHVTMECQKKFKQSSGGSCPPTPGPNSRSKGNSWSSEDEAFVFPQGNGSENSKGLNAEDSNSDYSGHSTYPYTDFGVWAPEEVTKNHTDMHTLPAFIAQNSSWQSRSSLGSSLPESSLREKMSELRLQRDKSREPD